MEYNRMPSGFCRHSKIAGLIIAVGLGFQSLPTATALNNPGLGPDILYVGDENDNTVKSFNADTGASLDGAAGAFVTSGSGGLNGPTGLLIAGPELIVVNQNFGGANGEILQYQLKDGSFIGPWVSQSDPNAPFAPRGAVLKNGVLYVSNFVEDDAGTAGEVLVFAGSGELLGKLTPSGGLRKKFRPRGVVIGPDGLLYVSSDPNFEAGPGPTTGGQVLRFDPNTLAFKDVFIDDSGGVGQLNRPEGLVFDPDGKKLYVTSFCDLTFPCPTAANIDSIRVYDAAERNKFLGQINLDPVARKVAGQTRATAQALLFGPRENLFIPTTLRPAFSGEVLSCDVENTRLSPAKPLDATRICSPFVPADGPLGIPFYLTFGRTDSATLTYPNTEADERKRD
jgi:DNA-binding beta-propeller fold protein YncE